MPLILGPSATGIVPVGDGSLEELELLIPNPDNLDNAGSIGYHLDEMSPAAATQLRIEINQYLATSGEAGVTYAVGSHTVTAGEVTAEAAVIDTGLDDITIASCIVKITRGGADVTRDAVITEAPAGSISVVDGAANYVLTAGDIVRYYATA